jgi:hypothetical protein
MSKQLYGTCCLLVEIAAFTSWTASGVGCKRTLRAFSQNGLRAEGYAAGELKHGPIALIDETMPVIVIAPCDRVFDKTVPNMQEVAARGGRLIEISTFYAAKLVLPPWFAFRACRARRIAGRSSQSGSGIH